LNVPSRLHPHAPHSISRAAAALLGDAQRETLTFRHASFPDRRGLKIHHGFCGFGTLMRITNAIRTRGRFLLKKAGLDLKRAIAGNPIWVDYGWMKLPYNGDGDRQEMYYHLDGKQWWEAEKRVLSAHVKPGFIAVDVGANLGFLTGLLSQLVGPSGHVHSFEPSPRVFAKLVEVVRTNALENVTPHNLGCGEKSAAMTLHVTRSSGNSCLRLRSEFASQVRKTQDVQIVGLDTYLSSKLPRLDFLKIDTEGFEDCVLEGARGLLSKFRPMIYIELTSEYIDCSRRAVSILKESGYWFEQEPALEKCHNGQNFFSFPPRCQSPEAT